MVFFLKLVLTISLFFNFALYFWWMDVGQYRNYVDGTIEDVKEIWASEEFQTLKKLVKEKLVWTYNENLWDSVLNQKVQEVQWTLTEFGVESATNKLKEQYPELTESEITQIIKAAADFQTASIQEQTQNEETISN